MTTTRRARRGLWGSVLAATTLAVVALAVVSPSAGATDQVGPGQAFVGRVNVAFRPTPGSPDARTSVVSVSYLNPAVGPTSRSRFG